LEADSASAIGLNTFILGKLLAEMHSFPPPCRSSKSLEGKAFKTPFEC
jgi:hypothetical protein